MYSSVIIFAYLISSSSLTYSWEDSWCRTPGIISIGSCQKQLFPVDPTGGQLHLWMLFNHVVPDLPLDLLLVTFLCKTSPVILSLNILTACPLYQSWDLLSQFEEIATLNSKILWRNSILVTCICNHVLSAITQDS